MGEKNIMRKNHIVIAVYNENIDWISMIDINMFDIFIYYKGSGEIATTQKCIIIPLKNVGRESHTYLYHIIEHYDNLPEHVLFFQGRPNDHVSKDFLKQINVFDKDQNTTFHNFSQHCLTIKYDDKTKKLKEEGYLQQGIGHNYWVNYHDLNCPLVDVFQKLYGFTDLTKIDIEFIPGANFSVCRQLITNKPKSFYTNCIGILYNSNNLVNPSEGHSFERLWKYIFMKI